MYYLKKTQKYLSSSIFENQINYMIALFCKENDKASLVENPQVVVAVLSY
jgi:hypothetical protein